VSQSNSVSVAAASVSELATFLERVHAELSPGFSSSIGMDLRSAVKSLKEASLSLQFAAAGLKHEEAK